MYRDGKEYSYLLYVIANRRQCCEKTVMENDKVCADLQFREDCNEVLSFYDNLCWEKFREFLGEIMKFTMLESCVVAQFQHQADKIEILFLAKIFSH